MEVAAGHDMTVYDALGSPSLRWSAQASPGLQPRGVVNGVVSYLVSAFGPPKAFRQEAFSAFRQALDALPPYAGGTLTSEVDCKGPLHDPVLERNYSYDGSCLDLQAYCEQSARATGWTVQESASYLADGTSTESDFRQVVSDVSPRLLVDCDTAPTAQPMYTIQLDTVNPIGP